jgi:hypothetical protein
MQSNGCNSGEEVKRREEKRREEKKERKASPQEEGEWGPYVEMPSTQ